MPTVYFGFILAENTAQYAGGELRRMNYSVIHLKFQIPNGGHKTFWWSLILTERPKSLLEVPRGNLKPVLKAVEVPKTYWKSSFPFGAFKSLLETP